MQESIASGASRENPRSETFGVCFVACGASSQQHIRLPWDTLDADL